MESVSLYTTTRNEYLIQLSNWIVPPLVEFFRKEYSKISTAEPKKAMLKFQEFCAEVPRWNQDIIDANIGIILDNCRCDYVEELMTAIFIAHTKMLTAIRISSKQKKLQITLPKLDHFLHRVFIECARGFWKAPYLFSDELAPIERQKNILQAESMCTEALSGAVRSLLPVKSILRDYLDEEDSDSDNDKKSSSKKSKNVEDSDEDEKITETVRESVSDILSQEQIQPIIPAATPVAAPAATPVATPVAAPAATPVAAPVAVPVAAPVVAPVAAPVVTPVEVLSQPIVIPVTNTLIPTVQTPQQESLPQNGGTQTIEQISIADHLPRHIETVVQKMDLPQEPAPPTISSHSVQTPAIQNSVGIEKLDTINPPKLVIETEPTVHFTPYDTVFDENSNAISEIRYAPKISVEDKPPSNWGMFDDNDDEIPKLSISNNFSQISGDDIEDLESPSRPTTPGSVDVPFSATGDFEELS